MHTDRGSVCEPGLTLSASSVHNGVNTQKIGSNRDLSLLWPNGWMDEDAAWYTEVDLGPGHIVLYGVPAPAKGAQQPPSFRPMSIVYCGHGRPSQLLLSSCSDTVLLSKILNSLRLSNIFAVMNVYTNTLTYLF